ncbi:hypothetical protein [Pseudomonas reactans]|uniref:hypothetical protein n=1 Tax=Pseudomonas reactans TaxID=117680 RepID=UPI0015A3F74C|nr:hypothetical protein [Pseudomonas reactans]NWC90519.1 hypothetical protein [Pseudomonas reactans]
MDVKGTAKKLAKGSARAVWHIIVPGAAMKRTLVLTKREIARNKENALFLKDLSVEARRVLSAKKPKEGPLYGLSFEDVMAARSPDAPSRTELYRSFLMKKRWALLAATFFAVSGFCAVVGGITFGHPKDIALGAVSLLVSQPVFYMAALGAQLRLWQLQTKRLSVQERGSLRDFMSDYRDWFVQPLNPELNWYRRFEEPNQSNGGSSS